MATSIQFGSEYTFYTNCDTISISSYPNSSGFIVTYIDLNDGNDGASIFGEVSGAYPGTEVGFGSAYDFTGNNTVEAIVQTIGTSSGQVVARKDRNQSNGMYANYGDVSGTVIAWSGEATADATDQVTYIDVAAISDTKFVVCYQDSNHSRAGRCTCGEISSSGTITFDALQGAFVSSQAFEIVCCPQNPEGFANRFFVAYRDNSDSDHGTMRSGLVGLFNWISYGGSVEFVDDASATFIGIERLEEDKCVVVYKDGGDGNALKARICTAVFSTITLHDEIELFP